MRKKIRKRIFFFITVVFFITTPLILLYAEGYRFDIKTFQIQKTGGFFAEAEPKKAQIYINNKLKGTTPSLVRNILPGFYDIRVEKDGFYSWQKQLEVLPGIVTEAYFIQLFPKQLKSELTLQGDFKTILLSPDKKIATIIKTTNSQENIFLFDIENQKLLEEEALSSFNAQLISQIIWSKDSQWLFFKQNNTKTRWIFYSLENNEIIFLDNIIKDQTISIKKILPDLRNPDNLFLLSKKNELKMLSLKNKNIGNFLVKNIRDAIALENDLLVVNTDNKLLLLNLDSSLKANLKDNFLSNLKQVEEKNGLIILDNENNLHLFYNNSELPNFISQVLGFKSSKDKLVFWTKDNTQILFLKEDSRQPKRKISDMEIIPEIKEQEVFWFNEKERYILSLENNQIVIAETDGRNQRNVYKLTIGSTPINQIIGIKNDFWLLDQEGLKNIQRTTFR